MTPRSLLAATSYEFRMQVRRRAAWIAVAVGAGLALAATLNAEHDPGALPAGRSAAFMVGNLFLIPVVFGVLLSDRLRRERRLQVDEVLDGLPAGEGIRLWGKFLGAGAGTAFLLLVAYVADTVLVSLIWRDVTPALAMMPVAFAAIVLPGLTFVAGLTLLLTEWLPAPAFSVLFVIYWVWGNVAPSDQVGPTPSCTLLSPIGHYASLAFFRQPTFLVGHDECYRLGLRMATVGQGIASIALLAACGVGAVALLHIYRAARAATR